jgi:hypothetical protein
MSVPEPNSAIQNSRKKLDPSVRYVGLEIECFYPSHDYPSDLLREWENQSFGTAPHLGDDGSITRPPRHYTAEFATPPLAPDELDEFFTLWKEFENKMGLGVNASCGVHIHVSRAPLTNAHILRARGWMMHPSVQSLLGKLAGRSLLSGLGRRYASTASMNAESVFLSETPVNRDSPRYWDASIRAYRVPKLVRGENRYTALNLSNVHTIEFRLFAGATRTEVLRRYVETVNAILDFTEHPYTRNKAISLSDQFLRFVNGYSPFYPTLHAYLAGI